MKFSGYFTILTSIFVGLAGILPSADARILSIARIGRRHRAGLRRHHRHPAGAPWAWAADDSITE